MPTNDFELTVPDLYFILCSKNIMLQADLYVNLPSFSGIHSNDLTYPIKLLQVCHAQIIRITYKVEGDQLHNIAQIQENCNSMLIYWLRMIFSDVCRIFALLARIY